MKISKLAKAVKEREEAGFTLAELLVVITVLGVLAAIVVPTYGSVADKSRLAAVQSAATNAYRLASLQLTASSSTEELANSINSMATKDVDVRFVDSEGEVTEEPTSDFCIEAVWREAPVNADGDSTISSLKGDCVTGEDGDVGSGDESPDPDIPDSGIDPTNPEDMATVTSYTINCPAGVDSVRLPVSGFVGNIYWSDSTTSTNPASPKSVTPGEEYTVTLDGQYTNISTSTLTADEARCFVSMDAWGSDTKRGVYSGDTFGSFAFADMSNLVAVPAELPPYIKSTSYMFRGATSFNGNISGWDTTNVTNMSGMFQNARSFNQPIGNWNTASVINMENLFNGAINFNQPLNDWETGLVRSFMSTFSGAIRFNQPLDGWETGSAITMTTMFSNAADFNQSLNSWDTSKVVGMTGMFNTFLPGLTSKFNGDISGWGNKLNNVTSMSNMFAGASSFNQNISSWAVPKIATKPSTFDTNSGFRGQAAMQPRWGASS